MVLINGNNSDFFKLLVFKLGGKIARTKICSSRITDTWAQKSTGL